MTRKPFAWAKLTPAQIDLMERIAAADNALAYDKLDYRDLLAFEELQKLKIVDMRPMGRSRLAAVLTNKGQELSKATYRTDQIVVRVTGPQIELLRFLNDAPEKESVGQPESALQSMMIDVCRRMSLRGWVEWYDGWNGKRWARLTSAGREVVNAVDALDEAISQAASAKRDGRLH